MSPFTETDGGAMYQGGDLADEAQHADAEERERQEAARREVASRVGTGARKPAEQESAERPEGYRDTAQFGREEHERIRVAALADPRHPLNDARHPAHEATVEKYLRLGMMADGKDYDDPEENEVIGEVLPDGRMLAPENNPPLQMPTLSAMAQGAGFAWNEQRVTALTALADVSGLPRYHVQLFYEDLAAAVEEESAAEEESTRASCMAELTRLEGAGRAEQTAADARELVARFAESGIADLKATAKDLTALGNSPRVIIGAARLYRELCNLPPRGPWEQVLLGGGERWAQERAAGKVRAAQAAKAAQTPDDFIVSYGGRP